jgi:hypothetical protein
MGYRPLLACGTTSARAANASVQVLGSPVHAAPAVAWAGERASRGAKRGPGPCEPRQAVLVVAHPQKGAEQKGRRNSDKPYSKEDQPEGHALPVIAYRELYRMVSQPQDAALVSSRTLRRNPARVGDKTPRSAPSAAIRRVSGCGRHSRQRPNHKNKFTVQDWTGSTFWVTSIPRASWTPCSRPQGSPRWLSTQTLEGDPAFAKRRSPRRFADSHGCPVGPDPANPPPVLASNGYSPVQTPSPRLKSLATSLSRLNVPGPDADAVLYGPNRSFA